MPVTVMVRLRGDAEGSLGRRWRKRGKVMAEQSDVGLQGVVAKWDRTRCSVRDRMGGVLLPGRSFAAAQQWCARSCHLCGTREMQLL